METVSDVAILPSTSSASPQRRDFPEGFPWDCATSSCQIEGAGQADGRAESILEHFAATQGKIRGGPSGAMASDHYHRWLQDLDLAQVQWSNVPGHRDR